MKTSFKKLLFCFLAICTTSISFAQDFQGKAVYLSKTTMDLDNFGRGDLSEEQKKRIADRMKSMFEKTYILTFNQAESTYKEEEKLEAPGGQSRGFGMMMSNFTGGTQYKNVKEQKVLQEQEFFGKQFLINDELEKLEWKLEGETKQIGQYLCMKATAIKKVDEMDFTRMRRRPPAEEKNEKSIDSTKTIHIGESGWTTISDGHYGKKSSRAADEYKAGSFYKMMREWTNKEKISLFYFEAFDEQWKDAKNPIGSENHFGLINLKGQAKYAIWDLVDAGKFNGLTRDGMPITKTYNGVKTELLKDVIAPPQKKLK